MEDSNVYANLPAVLGGARPALGTAFVRPYVAAIKEA